ncbi:MAG: ABC transporter transmembrane domain-containing protein, partial [Chlamydiales bacterium]
MVALVWAANLSLTPYAMKLIIDGVSSKENKESLFSVLMFPALLYVGLGFSISLVFRLYDWLIIKTFPQMEVEITEEVFDYTEKHSYNYFHHQFAGSLGNKINDISKGVGRIISYIVEQFLSSILGLIIGMITMYLVNPYFSLMLFVWSFIFISASLILSKKAQNYSEKFSEARSTVVGRIVDSIGNILNVKLFARGEYENKHLHSYLEKAATIDRQGKWYLLKVKALYAISITFLTTAMVWLLIYERSKNNITVGDFALILTLNMFLIDQVYFIAIQLVPFSEEVGTCKQALSILSRMHEIVDLPDAKPIKILKGQICFDKVYFQYKKGQSVFADKSITINPGERVGLVGFSGSGKSTFVNLILRFFDLDSGTIWIDGQDIKT